MTARAFLTVGTGAETTITVTRTAATTDRPQGLVFDADHPLHVGAHTAPKIVLWADRCPETVEILTSEAGDIRIWHVWRDGDLIQAWESDASMTVDDGGDTLELSCTDGHDGPGPDLVVGLSFDRAWTQPAGSDDD